MLTAETLPISQILAKTTMKTRRKKTIAKVKTRPTSVMAPHAADRTMSKSTFLSTLTLEILKHAL